MMFKKISLLAVIFAMIGNVCFAANWIWLASNDEMSIYFDGNRECIINCVSELTAV